MSHRPNRQAQQPRGGARLALPSDAVLQPVSADFLYRSPCACLDECCRRWPVGRREKDRAAG
jgi:hypothetical protein